jgi:hypothetical protein
MLHDNKEQVPKMKRFRLIGVTLLAALALSAVGASVALAGEDAPFWSIEGTRLTGGETHFITAKVYKEGEAGHELTLTTPKLGITISCTGLSLPFRTGVILGSTEEEPGRNDEVAHFTGCKVTGNGTKCNVENKEVTTLPIKSELVENVEEVEKVKKAGKKLLVEFAPFTGEVFAEIKFKEEAGGKCTNKTTKVTGSVAARVQNSGGKDVELPNTLEEGTTWLTEFPPEKEAIEKVWLVKAGVGSAVEVGPLVAFGDDSFEEGVALVLLAKVTGTTLESEEREWSPLP